jgi:S1-C subfamily serine protease
VGINTAVLNREYGGPEGIGFAIPVNLVRGVMEQILAHGRVIRGWLGFIPQDLTEDQAARVGAAVVVANVLVDSPADHAGIRPNDLLTALDGEQVRTAQDMVSRLAALAPGAEVQLEGLRGRDAFKVKMKVVERPTRTAQRQTP